MDDRRVEVQRPRSVEVPLVPLVANPRPVDGMFGAGLLQPPQARFAPELPSLVSAVVNEQTELFVGNRGARDLERGDLHGVRPLLVVEYEALAFCGPQHEIPPGNLSVAF